MLDKKSEQVLSYIIAEHNKNPGKSDNVILLSHKDFDLSCDELNSLCSNLLKQDYIYPFYRAYENDPAEIEISHKGLSYFEIKRKECLNKWLNRLWGAFTGGALLKLAEFIWDIFAKKP